MSAVFEQGARVQRAGRIILGTGLVLDQGDDGATVLSVAAGVSSIGVQDSDTTATAATRLVFQGSVVSVDAVTGIATFNLDGRYSQVGHKHDGADITGTVPDARLSSNVPLLNAANVWGALQTLRTNTLAGPTTLLHLDVTGNGASGRGGAIQFSRPNGAGTSLPSGRILGADNASTRLGVQLQAYDGVSAWNPVLSALEGPNAVVVHGSLYMGSSEVITPSRVLKNVSTDLASGIAGKDIKNVFTQIQTFQAGTSDGWVGTSSSRIFTGRSLARYTSPTNVTGALVIHTGISGASAMTLLRIVGYLYNTSDGDIDFNLRFYNNAASNTRVTHKGSARPQVRIAQDAALNRVIILGNVGDTWTNPKIWVESAIVSHTGSAPGQEEGWTIAVETDLSGYTNLFDATDVSPWSNASNLNSGTVPPARVTGTGAESNYLRAMADDPTAYPTGLSVALVRSLSGWPGTYKVLTMGAVDPGNHGGALQLLVPYAAAAGGGQLQYRTGRNLTNGWTALKTIADTDWTDGRYVQGGGFFVNQNLRITDSPTFSSVYVTSWIRSTQNAFGLYNEANGYSWYADSLAGKWVSRSASGIALRDVGGAAKGYLHFAGGVFGLMGADAAWALSISDVGHRMGYGTTPHATYGHSFDGEVLVTNGWLRLAGSTGVWWETWGGGWSMTDATYIRAGGNKSVHVSAPVYATRFIDADNTGFYLDPAASSALQDVTVSGTLGFGSTTRQMITLFGTSYGIGIQAFTQYYRSDGGFAWFKGGVHHDGQNNPGAGGSLMASLASSGLGVVGGISAGGDIQTSGTFRDAATESGMGIVLAHIIPRTAAQGFDPGIVAPIGTLQIVYI